MLKRLARLVSYRPWWVLIGIFIITAGSVVFLPNLRTEADLTKMLTDNDPAVKTMAVVDSEFGGSSRVAMLVEASDIFAPNVLYALDTLIQQIEDMPGVNDVQGFTTLQDVKGIGDDIIISKIIDSIPNDPSQLQALRQTVLNDKRYQKVLVAEDGSSALFLIRLVPTSNKEAVVSAIEKVINNSRLKKGVSLAGGPALMKYMQDWMANDLKLLLPLAVLVLTIIMLISFRGWLGFLPLIGVLISVIWTFGLIGLLRQPITIVLVILPPILVSVGSAYSIHILERWKQEKAKGKTSIESAQLAVNNTGLPVFLAAATTMIGFAANMVCEIVAIRTFGLLSAVGTFFSFIIALTFVPAALSRLPMVVPRSTSGTQPRENRLNRTLGKWGVYISIHRWSVLSLAIVLVLIAGLFIPQVRTETDFVRYFKPNSRPTRAVQIITERFGGELQFEFIIEGDIQDPTLLQKIEGFEKDLKEISHITHTYSLVDILRSTNQAFNQGKPDFERLPETREAIAQYLLLLSFSGSDFLADFVSSDYKIARLSARFDSEESQQIALAIREIKKLIAKHFDTSVKVTVGGMPMAIERLHQNIQVSQFITLITAIIAIFILIAWLFKSVVLGLAALTPIGLTLVLNYGLMGILGIRQDVVTATLGSIVIGIGIDYSCHLIARFREEQNNSFTRAEIMQQTLTSVGPAILTNALAVGLGFAVLIFSSFMIIQTFGFLIAETMIFSSVGALTILATLLSRRARKVIAGD
jgi:hydrophobe/amphiphile efflux-3 (HAE3) family protein